MNKQVEVLNNDIIPCSNPAVRILSSTLSTAYVLSDGRIHFDAHLPGAGEQKDSIQYEVTCGAEKDTAWFYLIKIEDEPPSIKTLKATRNEIYIETKDALPLGSYFSIESEDGSFDDSQYTGRNNTIKTATFSGSFKGKYYVQVCIGYCCVSESITITESSGVSNVKANFSCPGQVTVTYDLSTTDATDVTLYYSPDGGKTWLIAQTVSGDLTAQTSGTGKTIIWDNVADHVRWGKFKLKVEVPKPEPKPDCVMIDGICWATRNVGSPGTFVDKPEEAGMFYQWNSTTGWSSTDPLTSTDGSSWNGSWDGNGAKTWEISNNVCPVGYRIPTSAEIQRLVNANSEWVTINGINGIKFGSGNDTIFVPAISYRMSNGSLATAFQNDSGFFWGSDLLGNYAYHLYISSFGPRLYSNGTRANGEAVRCVKE